MWGVTTEQLQQNVTGAKLEHPKSKRKSMTKLPERYSDLTDTQASVLRFIEAYVAKHSEMPSQEHIRKELGLKGGTPFSAMRGLCTKGYMKKLGRNRYRLLERRSPQASKRTRVQSAEDGVGGYLKERVRPSAHSTRIHVSALYQDYAQWRKESGRVPMSQRKFGNTMSKIGHHRINSSGGRAYVGLALIESDTAETAAEGAMDSGKIQRIRKRFEDVTETRKEPAPTPASAPQGVRSKILEDLDKLDAWEGELLGELEDVRAKRRELLRGISPSLAALDTLKNIL